jgi:hypothetical protein
VFTFVKFGSIVAIYSRTKVSTQRSKNADIVAKTLKNLLNEGFLGVF